MSSLASTGFLRVGACDLEYRMIGPAPHEAPTIIMLHEGLGSVGLWGDFPDRLQAATGFGVLAYSRAGYGASTPVKLPRPLDYMHIAAGSCSGIQMEHRSPRSTLAASPITACAGWR